MDNGRLARLRRKYQDRRAADIHGPEFRRVIERPGTGDAGRPPSPVLSPPGRDPGRDMAGGAGPDVAAAGVPAGAGAPAAPGRVSGHGPCG